MSKQLTLSAALAAFSMALLSLAASHGSFAGISGGTAAGAPLFELTVAR